MVGPSGIATGVVRGGLAAGWLATGTFTARNDVIRAVEPARLSAPASWVRGPGVSAPPPVAASQLERPVGGGGHCPGLRTPEQGVEEVERLQRGMRRHCGGERAVHSLGAVWAGGAELGAQQRPAGVASRPAVSYTHLTLPTNK